MGDLPAVALTGQFVDPVLAKNGLAPTGKAGLRYDEPHFKIIEIDGWLVKVVRRFAVYIIDKTLKTYWNLFKPNTYGVKALILHPSDPELCVMIRQSYGDQDRWGLPGGGYRPKRESAEDAVRRECLEELGLEF